MNKFLLAAAAATSLTLPAAPAFADHGHGYQQAQYSGPVWRGQDGRYYCKKSNGTTGLLIGGAAGALVGRAIDTRGSRASGTIVGAAAGALLGRHVQRNSGSRRCR